MHILIGLGIAVALGYFWLIGMWYARVLVCILMVVTFGGFVLAAAKGQQGAIPMALFAAAVGWAIGSIPVWVWRERAKDIAAAESKNALMIQPSHGAQSPPYYRY
jgi:hypothetical protein